MATDYPVGSRSCGAIAIANRSRSAAERPGGSVRQTAVVLRAKAARGNWSLIRPGNVLHPGRGRCRDAGPN